MEISLRTRQRPEIAALAALTLIAVTLVPSVALANGCSLTNASLDTQIAALGSETYPFEIATTDDLAAITSCDGSGVHFRLTASLAFTGSSNWTPIDLAGYLNGAGRTISGLHVRADNAAGLFRELSPGSAIVNLTLIGPDIQATATEVANPGGVASAGALFATGNGFSLYNIQVLGAKVAVVPATEVVADELKFGPANARVGAVGGFALDPDVVSSILVDDPELTAFADTFSVGGLFGLLDLTSTAQTPPQQVLIERLVISKPRVISDTLSENPATGYIGGIAGRITKNQVGTTTALKISKAVIGPDAAALFVEDREATTLIGGVAGLSQPASGGGTINLIVEDVGVHATIRNSGGINWTSSQGALFGQYSGQATVTRAYFAGNFTAGANITGFGGLVYPTYFVGDSADQPFVTDSYFDSDLTSVWSGENSSKAQGALAKSTAALKTPATFENWLITSDVREARDSGGENPTWFLGSGAGFTYYPVPTWVYFVNADQIACFFSSGDGSIEEPFLVATEADLNELRNCGAGEVYRQTNDIVLTAANWQPITSFDSDAFSGLYDGGGYSISNLRITAGQSDIGLFSKLLGAQIQDLSLSGSVITSAPVERVGLLAGRAEGSTLRGLSAAVLVEAPNATYVGGLFGYYTASSALDLSVTGSVTGGQTVGGIAGSSLAAALQNIDAAVAVTGTSYVGGGIGQLQQSVISGMKVSGGVVAVESRAGGLAAQAEGSVINGAVAEGDVTGSEIVGGIVGELIGSAILNAAAIGDVSGTDYVGGFMGAARGSSVSRSFATGAVTGSLYAGGFAGIVGGPGANDSIAIVNSYALGDVTFNPADGSTGKLGGFVGSVGESTAIANAYSFGTVDPLAAARGGFLGDLSAQSMVAIGNSFYNGEANALAFPAAFDELAETQVSIMTTGLTRAQFKDIDSFAVFDISAGQPGPDEQSPTVWGICPLANDGLPFLNWAHDPDFCLAAEENEVLVELPAPRQPVSKPEVSDSIAGDGDEGHGLRAWIVAIGPGQAKFYTRGLIGAGKVQYFLNGREVAWVRAVDESDPKLRIPVDGPMANKPYLVRTVELAIGRKNVLEIYVAGERVRRVAYTR